MMVVVARLVAKFGDAFGSKALAYDASQSCLARAHVTYRLLIPSV